MARGTHAWLQPGAGSCRQSRQMPCVEESPHLKEAEAEGERRFRQLKRAGRAVVQIEVLRELRETSCVRRPSADGQLVEGPERPLRVLPLSAAVPSSQHQQGDAGRGLRR